MQKLLIRLGILILGVFIGWLYAHVTVATECKRLGGFYVGNEIYHCHFANDASEGSQ